MISCCRVISCLVISRVLTSNDIVFSYNVKCNFMLPPHIATFCVVVSFHVSWLIFSSGNFSFRIVPHGEVLENGKSDAVVLLSNI